MKIYLIVGATGEYSSHMEWPVVAYDDEAVARDHVDRAKARADQIQAGKERYETPKEANEWDPKMSMDYTGTDYCLHEIVLNMGAKEPVKA